MKMLIVCTVLMLLGCYDKSLSQNCGQGFHVQGCETGNEYKKQTLLIVP